VKGKAPLTGNDRLATLTRGRRTELGISQKHLARLVRVDRSALSRWERGRQTPCGVRLFHVCHLLRISWPDLA
jgi:transcriptional regulator with XRE-family HTH domain